MLPTILARVTVHNPNFVSGSTLPGQHYWTTEEREVEVLTLNLNSGGMRVRYKDTDPTTGKTKINTTDLSISLFNAKYEIREKA